MDMSSSSIYSKSNAETQTKGFSELLTNDYLVRVTSRSAELKSIDYIDANNFTSEIRNWIEIKTQEVADLASVVKWQHNLLDYNAHYNAFLLEQITDDEFEIIASEFAYDPQSADTDDIVRVVHTLLHNTGIEYSPSDIADLFRCEQDIVLDAIKILSNEYPNLVKMLPEHN